MLGSQYPIHTYANYLASFSEAEALTVAMRQTRRVVGTGEQQGSGEITHWPQNWAFIRGGIYF